MTAPPSKASLLVIFLTVFIDLLGFGIVLPLLPIYAEQFAQGMTPAQTGWTIGLLMASYSTMQFFFAPIWGRLSDRLGRRPLLLLGLSGSVVFYALFGVATIWGSLAWLFVSRIGAGIAGATISTAQAYIADVTSKETRARGMALIGAAFGLGFTLGPLLGAAAIVLSPENGGRSPWPGYLAALLSAAALLLAWFKLPESRKPGHGEASRERFDLTALITAVSIPSVLALILASFVGGLAFANLESTLSRNVAHWIESEEPSGDAVADLPPKRLEASEQADDESASAKPGAAVNPKPAGPPASNRAAKRQHVDRQVLMVFTYLGLVLTFSQGVLVRGLSTRVPEAVMATCGAGTAVLGFLLLGWATQVLSWPLLYGALAVELIGFSFVTPSLNSLISRRSDPAQQGGVLGLLQSSSSLARILGPIFANLMFVWSPQAPFWFAAALMGVGLGLIAIAVRGGHDFPSG